MVRKGEHLIWLEPSVVDRLRSMRGPGESYSDVILRLAGGGWARALSDGQLSILTIPQPCYGGSQPRAYTARQHAGSEGGNDPRCFRGALVHHIALRRFWNGHWRPLFLETR